MRAILILGIAILLSASPAHAYVGPGLGLGAIGAFFGAIAAGLLMVLGFFWYPIKRLLGRRNDKTRSWNESPTSDQ